MKRKLFTFLLAIVASVGLIHAGTEIGGLYYNLNSTNKTAQVTQSATSSYSRMTEIIIPTSVNYKNKTYSVTSIQYRAFTDCSSLTSVTIPSSIIEIGERAFYGCSSLNKVNISDLSAWCNIYFFDNHSNPLYYAKHLFLNDIEIIDLVIPNGITSIRQYAFDNCCSLLSVTIPNTVASIGSEAFSDCSGLTSVLIPNTVTNIESKAFYNIPNIVYSGAATGSPWGARSVNGYIDGWLVYNDESKTKLLACSSAAIGELIIPEGVKSIGERAFNGCSGLTSVTIPESVTSIGISAFKSCSSLSSVIIPNSITDIGSSAFFDCSSLTSVTIGNSITSIGSEAFIGCSINQIYYNGTINGWCKKTWTPKSISSNYSLYIGGEKIESCEIPNSITSIESETFYGCSSLTSINIPNRVTNIKRRAFYDCKSLTSVTIANSVKSIEGYAFDGCTKLNAIYINDLASWCNIDFESQGEMDFFHYSNPLYDAHHLYLNGYEIIDLVIPDGIKSIKQGAFEGGSGIASVTIPNSVTSIGDGAFWGCSNLTSVTIPNSVTSLGNRTFFNCASLSSVILSNSADYIGNKMFENCNSLTSVTIPSSVIRIGGYAFKGCSSLTSVIIPNSLKSIDECAFYGCSSLTSVTIPSSVTSIGSFAFYDCSSLTSMTIPNRVLYIADYTFYGCSSLTFVIIPNSVEYILRSAFCNCKSLSYIYALSPTPPDVSADAFSGIPSDAIVYVQSLSAYQSASGWKNMNLIGISDAETLAAPTSVSISAIHNLWALDDNYIVSVGVEGGDTYAGNIMEFTGLDPETEYTKTIVLTSNTGETETLNVSFTTTALQLTTQQPKIVSSSMAILLAETNMADAEVNCGFEWKRNDAPADMAGTKVYAPVANGSMAGRLKGLKDDVYYKYRAFYESKAGKMVYGDWQYIFTGDNTVEFDPIMYTYPAQAVTETTATLKGYALAGSDDFTEQGFEYWVEVRVIIQNGSNAPRRAYRSVVGEHMTVQASGISMKVTLTDLDEGSVYKYRSYAVVDGQTIYGSEETFTTRGEYLYTVTFVDYDGTILGTDKVHYGTSATAPEDPTREGYNFDGWDLDFSNVTDDLTITATYSIATAIADTRTENSDVRKVLRNGQLFILRGDKTYTIQGQEVR